MERNTNSTFIFWPSVFCVGLCFRMHYFVSVIVLQWSLRGRENWLLCFNCLFLCLVSVNIMWLFLTVPCVGLQCVIVVFPDHIHLFFQGCYNNCLCCVDYKKSRNTDMTLAVSNILKIWFTVRNTNSSFIFIWMIFIFSTMVSYGVF